MKNVLKFLAIVLACALFVGLVNVLFPYHPGTGKPDTAETGEAKSNLSWHMKDVVDHVSEWEYTVDFVVNGVNYCKIAMDTGAMLLYPTNTPTTPVQVYVDVDGWSDPAYQEIVFAKEPPAALLTWLEANAVRQ